MSGPLIAYLHFLFLTLCIMEASVKAYHCTLLCSPVRALPSPERAVCLQSSRGALQQSYLDGPASWDEVDTEELERIAVNILRSVVPSTENLEVGARLAMQVGPPELVHAMCITSEDICGGKRPASLFLGQSNHMRHGIFKSSCLMREGPYAVASTLTAVVCLCFCRLLPWGQKTWILWAWAG